MRSPSNTSEKQSSQRNEAAGSERNGTGDRTKNVMRKGIYIVIVHLTVNEFIEALFEAQREPPAFAMPACAEAVISFETLIKRHTNLDEGDFANCYGFLAYRF